MEWKKYPIKIIKEKTNIHNHDVRQFDSNNIKLIDT